MKIALDQEAYAFLISYCIEQGHMKGPEYHRVPDYTKAINQLLKEEACR